MPVSLEPGAWTGDSGASVDIKTAQTVPTQLTAWVLQIEFGFFNDIF